MPFNLHRKYDISPNPIRDDGRQRPSKRPETSIVEPKDFSRNFMNLQMQEMFNLYGQIGHEQIDEFNKTNIPDAIEEFLIEYFQSEQDTNPQRVQGVWNTVRNQILN